MAPFFRSWTSTATTVRGKGLESRSFSGSGGRSSGGSGEYSVSVNKTNWNWTWGPGQEVERKRNQVRKDNVFMSDAWFVMYKKKTTYDLFSISAIIKLFCQLTCIGFKGHTRRTIPEPIYNTGHKFCVDRTQSQVCKTPITMSLWQMSRLQRPSISAFNWKEHNSQQLNTADPRLIGNKIQRLHLTVNHCRMTLQDSLCMISKFHVPGPSSRDVNIWVCVTDTGQKVL